MKTNVYIDGFNLYYGALKGETSTKWLDLERLCRKVLPHEEIHRIRYFTAKITNRSPQDTSQQRQELYLRALTALPSVSIHYGKYLASTTTMRAVEPPPKYVKVHKSEEKGSDVNLACNLLMDAFKNDADRFIVLSNDSDLLEPLRMVKDDLGKSIGLLNPQARASKRLQACHPDVMRNVRAGHARSCQFSDPLDLGDGIRLTKPQSW